MTTEPEVTARQALEILGYTNLSTITHYVQSGKLTPSRELARGYRLFWRADVIALRDAQAAEPPEIAAQRARGRRNGRRSAKV